MFPKKKSKKAPKASKKGLKRASQSKAPTPLAAPFKPVGGGY